MNSVQHVLLSYKALNLGSVTPGVLCGQQPDDTSWGVGCEHFCCCLQDMLIVKCEIVTMAGLNDDLQHCWSMDQ